MISNVTNANPKKILIIYEHRGNPTSMRLSVRHHLCALEAHTEHEITYFNSADLISSWIIEDQISLFPDQLRYKQFDVLILHTTFLCMRWTGDYFLKWKKRFAWIAEIKCLKIAIPQDEYDHSLVLDNWLLELGVQVVFTNFGISNREILHPLIHNKVHFIECLTGYIHEPTAFKMADKLPKIKKRPFDIVYRARHLPYWFGNLGQCKSKIAKAALFAARKLKLTCNISTRQSDAIEGSSWLKFLSSARGVIGCESGSSVTDPEGKIKNEISELVRDNPLISYSNIKKKYSTELDTGFFPAIGPRHFEAIICKTCQLLVEGDYNSVLFPQVHYISIKNDYSNIEEAFSLLQNPTYVNKMITKSYEDIFLSGKYSYKVFAELIESVFI